MGSGSAGPLAHRSVGILAFNPGCDLAFTKWKTEGALNAVQIRHNKVLKWLQPASWGTAAQRVKITQPHFYAHCY